MKTKFGNILMLAAIAALMFLAGLSAPDSVRSSLSIPGPSKAPALAAPASVAAPPAVAASTPLPAAAAAPATAKTPPILLESLQVPVPPPAGRQFALQAGQFASEDAAAALGASLSAQKLPFDQPIRAVDQGGTIWYIVAIGPYATLDAARAARTQAGLKLNLGGLPAIMLPPTPPPKS